VYPWPEGVHRGTVIDQNLMLEIAGKLSADTRLSLRLNDQDLPLSPEGRSAELRELDEVSVRLSSPYGNVSLGTMISGWKDSATPGWSAAGRGGGGV